MTKEEILEAISNDKTMPFIQPEQLAQIVAFVINNYQPSLPSNLDEAAHNHAANNGGRWLTDDIGIKCFAFNPQEVEDAFKDGAEWMAGQGVTIEDEVCELYDELYLYYIDDCSSMTPDTSCEMLKELGASKGDKVVVQIRKK